MDKLVVEYKNWLIELKSKIHSTQVKAALAVNSALINFYWELGKMIAEKENEWGSKLIERLAKDLQSEFPGMKGLSRSNLFYCKQFYKFYEPLFVQQLVGQIQDVDNQSSINSSANIALLESNIESKNASDIQNKQQVKNQLLFELPWGHHIIIFTKCGTIHVANFYLHETIKNNWSRDQLALQLKSNLYERQGKSINNFSATLPKPLSAMAIKPPHFKPLQIYAPHINYENNLNVFLYPHLHSNTYTSANYYRQFRRQHLLASRSNY